MPAPELTPPAPEPNASEPEAAGSAPAEGKPEDDPMKALQDSMSTEKK